MADNTSIEWTDATWNVLTGCSVLSPGCTNCYAMKLAGSRLRNHPSRIGLTLPTKAGPVWTGDVRFNNGEDGAPDWLRQPLHWSKPRTIFVCAHSDIFHENVPDAVLHQIWAVMALAGHHTMQVLTKRSARMREFTQAIASNPAPVIDQVNHLKPNTNWNGNAFQARRNLEAGPLPNVWGGVSTEDQRRADERVPDVLQASLAHRFISAEPLLGPIDFTWIGDPNEDEDGVIDALRGQNWIDGFGVGVEMPRHRYGDGSTCHRQYVNRISPIGKLDWIIVGGESGPDARPMDPVWARSIRDQCESSGTLFMFKQWGSWHADALRYTDMNGRCPPPNMRIGKKKAGRLLDGREHNDVPQKETVNV